MKIVGGKCVVESSVWERVTPDDKKFINEVVQTMVSKTSGGEMLDKKRTLRF